MVDSEQLFPPRLDPQQIIFKNKKRVIEMSFISRLFSKFHHFDRKDLQSFRGQKLVIWYIQLQKMEKNLLDRQDDAFHSSSRPMLFGHFCTFANGSWNVLVYVPTGAELLEGTMTYIFNFNFYHWHCSPTSTLESSKFGTCV